jgi:hypothetical protein
MRSLHRLIGWIGLAGALVAADLIVLPAPPAAAAPPAQFYGNPWGGGPIWPGGVAVFAPDFTSPYAGSPGYPYYRYGAYYGSAYGPPYPVYPTFGAYYGGVPSTSYPSYSSAGGVAFGDTFGAGYFAPAGRCLYAASAGYGGSSSDPLSYGYYAPFC